MTQSSSEISTSPRSRAIARSVRGIATSDGAGVKLTRVIGTPLMPRIDPFLMLDEFRSDNPDEYMAGFPDHPHRGFETVTYMLAGRFRHRDNKGHEGVLESGGAQWMTAGRGIVHSEMPEQKEGLAWGFQLWLNLPAEDKMCEPGYLDMQPWDIPVVKLPGGAEARVLAGKVGEAEGAIKGRKTTPLYVDVTIPAGGSAVIAVRQGLAGFVYPFDGNGVRVPAPGVTKELRRGELGLLADEGDEARLEALDGPTRVLVVAGKPLREPVVQYGPFVMNTREQLEEAVADFRAGRL